MKALIIDDNDAIRQMYQLLLENMGSTTDVAENGSVWFHKIQNSDYDVIVSDMDMPVVNGMEFYQLVSSYRPHLLDRIVFSTGNGFNGEYKNFFGQTSCPVLYKPFPLNELKNTILSLNSNRFNGKDREINLDNIMPIYA
jgi:DNA-binding NtrC family response regulator